MAGSLFGLRLLRGLSLLRELLSSLLGSSLLGSVGGSSLGLRSLLGLGDSFLELPDRDFRPNGSIILSAYGSAFVQRYGRVDKD